MLVKDAKANEKLMVTEIKKVEPSPLCCPLPVIPLWSLWATNKLHNDVMESKHDLGRLNPHLPPSWEPASFHMEGQRGTGKAASWGCDFGHERSAGSSGQTRTPAECGEAERATAHRS